MFGLQTKLKVFFIALQNRTADNSQSLNVFPSAQCDSLQFCLLSGNLKTEGKQGLICDENKKKTS